MADTYKPKFGRRKPTEEEEKASSGPSTLRKVLAGGVRVGSGILGGIPATISPGVGTAIGAGVGGGGELLAQLVEGSPLSLKRASVEAGLTAIPGGWFLGGAKAVTKGARAASSAIRSGAIAGSGEAMREKSMGEDLDPKSIAIATGLGAATGGVLGSFTKAPVKKPNEKDVFLEATGVTKDTPKIKAPAANAKPTEAPPKPGASPRLIKTEDNTVTGGKPHAATRNQTTLVKEGSPTGPDLPVVTKASAKPIQDATVGKPSAIAPQVREAELRARGRNATSTLPHTGRTPEETKLAELKAESDKLIASSLDASKAQRTVNAKAQQTTQKLAKDKSKAEQQAASMKQREQMSTAAQEARNRAASEKANKEAFDARVAADKAKEEADKIAKQKEVVAKQKAALEAQGAKPKTTVTDTAVATGPTGTQKATTVLQSPKPAKPAKGAQGGATPPPSGPAPTPSKPTLPKPAPGVFQISNKAGQILARVNNEKEALKLVEKYGPEHYVTPPEGYVSKAKPKTPAKAPAKAATTPAQPFNPPKVVPPKAPKGKAATEAPTATKVAASKAAIPVAANVPEGSLRVPKTVEDMEVGQRIVDPTTGKRANPEMVVVGDPKKGLILQPKTEGGYIRSEFGPEGTKTSESFPKPSAQSQPQQLLPNEVAAIKAEIDQIQDPIVKAMAQRAVGIVPDAPPVIPKAPPTGTEVPQGAVKVEEGIPSAAPDTLLSRGTPSAPLPDELVARVEDFKARRAALGNNPTPEQVSAITKEEDDLALAIALAERAKNFMKDESGFLDIGRLFGRAAAPKADPFLEQLQRTNAEPYPTASELVSQLEGRPPMFGGEVQEAISREASDLERQLVDRNAADLAGIRGSTIDVPPNQVAQQLEAERQNIFQQFLAEETGELDLGRVAQGLRNVGALTEDVQQRLSNPQGALEVARNLAHLAPHFLRFNYLFSKNLPANAFVGPWGAGIMGSITKALSGDPRGMEALKMLWNPISVSKRMIEARDEALELLRHAEAGDPLLRAEMGGAELESLPRSLRTVVEFPARSMTAGDVGVRNILRDAGFTDWEAREMTLTSEPLIPLMQKMVNFRRGEKSVTGEILAPFVRTPANILEQGALATPVAGFFAHNMREARGIAKPEMAEQLVQQGMGTAVAALSYAAGANMDPETARTWNRYITNFAGPYSLQASLGFAAGQTVSRGLADGPVDALLSGNTAVELERSFPFPNTEPVTDWMRYARQVKGGEGVWPPPRGAIPSGVNDLLREPQTNYNAPNFGSKFGVRRQ